MLREQSITTATPPTTTQKPARLNAIESANGHNRECGLCHRPIRKTDKINWHHPIYKSQGGTDTIEVHQKCHTDHHRAPGPDGLSDFQRWGKLSALDCHWAFTLKGVKDNPLYDQARSYNRMYYSH